MSITDAELSMIENLPHTVDEGRLIAALREARADNARGVAAHMATSAERDRLRAEVIELRTARNKDRETVAHYRAAVDAVRALADEWERCGEGYAAAGVRDAAEGERIRVRAIRAALDEHLGEG